MHPFVAYASSHPPSTRTPPDSQSGVRDLPHPHPLLTYEEPLISGDSPPDSAAYRMPQQLDLERRNSLGYRWAGPSCTHSRNDSPSLTTLRCLTSRGNSSELDRDQHEPFLVIPVPKYQLVADPPPASVTSEVTSLRSGPVMADFDELVDRWRAAVEAESEHQLPPLNPPATDEDFVEVETALGRRMPEEIRELWSVTNGGLSLFDSEFLPLSRFVEATAMTKESWEAALGEFISDDSPYGLRPGDVPQGEYVVFANGMFVVELDGPAEGRVLWIDLTFGSEPAWRAIAPTIESLARFWVEVAEAGLIVLNRPPGHDFGYTYIHPERTDDAQAIARRHDVTGLV